jgi:signal transduction histidine kinase
MQFEADQKLKESRLQLSQKVHDKVANGIYRIMSEVEHLPDIDRVNLLDQLENIYDVSRNVAHDEPRGTIDFSENVSTMLYAFKKPSLKLAVTGNEKKIWEKISLDIREQLLLILQELMVNMSKHSRATQARVDFRLTDECVNVDYWDNGIGISGQAESGMGLNNTVSRMEALKGSVKFESSNEKGLRIEIQVPLKK